MYFKTASEEDANQTIDAYQRLNVSSYGEAKQAALLANISRADTKGVPVRTMNGRLNLAINTRLLNNQRY